VVQKILAERMNALTADKDVFPEKKKNKLFLKLRVVHPHRWKKNRRTLKQRLRKLKNESR
jgi:hypothetical protein